MTDKNAQNTNIPDRPQPTPTDKRINPTPDDEERMEREADKLAHKGIEHEREFDDMQSPFSK